MIFNFKGTKTYAEMLWLIKEIYNHEQTPDVLRTFILLRVKQTLSRDELDEWLKDEDSDDELLNDELLNDEDLESDE